MGGFGERYRIVRVIDGGGASEVLEAIEVLSEGIERRVVVKRLRASSQSPDPDLVAELLDEARTASQLHHANLVAVLGHGLDDAGLPYLVMEHVDGADLGTVVASATHRGVALAPSLAVHIAREVAHGLAYAHAATASDGTRLRIVHRDVTPSNVLLSVAGEVRLTDFGIARAERRASRTAVGVAKGTLAYMAPEQVSGGHIDRRADVFALGALLHFMLTGRSVATDLNVLARVSGQRAIDDGLPGPIRAVIERATAPRRADRYGTANEMATELWTAWIELGDHREPRSALVEWMGAGRGEGRRPSSVALDELIRWGAPLSPPPARPGTLVPEVPWADASETNIARDFAALTPSMSADETPRAASPAPSEPSSDITDPSGDVSPALVRTGVTEPGERAAAARPTTVRGRPPTVAARHTPPHAEPTPPRVDEWSTTASTSAVIRPRHIAIVLGVAALVLGGGLLVLTAGGERGRPPPLGLGAAPIIVARAPTPPLVARAAPTASAVAPALGQEAAHGPSERARRPSVVGRRQVAPTSNGAADDDAEGVAQIRRELEAALGARGVTLADVARVAPSATLALEEAAHAADAAGARAAARAILASTAEAALTPEVLGRRLERVGKRLLVVGAHADQAALRDVESAYFVLRQAFPPNREPAAVRRFAADLALLEGRCAALDRSEPAP